MGKVQQPRWMTDENWVRHGASMSQSFSFDHPDGKHCLTLEFVPGVDSVMGLATMTSLVSIGFVCLVVIDPVYGTLEPLPRAHVLDIYTVPATEEFSWESVRWRATVGHLKEYIADYAGRPGEGATVALGWWPE